MRHPLAVLLASTLLADTATAAILCQKKSGAIFVRDVCKKKETQVLPSALGLQPAIQGSCAPGQAAQAVGADGALTCADTVPNASVTSDQIVDVTRTLPFPARAIAFNPIAGITLSTTGLRYPNDNVVSYLTLPRPADWNGTSDVTIRLFVSPESSNPGNVQFYMRPRVYDPGDPFQDADAYLTDVVAVAESDSNHEVRVAIPATAFGTKAWWQLVVQRSDQVADAYPDGVVVSSLAIEYAAVR
jgi:hypothetical protein